MILFQICTEAVEGISFHFYAAIMPCSIVSQKSNSLHLCMKRNRVSSKSHLILFWKTVFNKRAYHHPIFNPSFFFIRLQMVSQLCS
jgi:hypothetical protein